MGQNCVVTGGSQGLGLGLAILLARKGANVTIVARTESKLKEALAEIEVSPS
jgi:3-dehydrosphinganine reductase